MSTSVIFSIPTAIVMSASPLAMLRYALLTAALPLAHAASTLIVPTSWKPAYSFTMTAGRVSSYQPPALPTVTFWMSFFCTPESSIAPLIDSNASSPRLTSVRFPNFEWPIPTIATFFKFAQSCRISLESIQRWTSEVPSTMSRIFASLRYLSSGRSLLSPIPPWIWIALSLTQTAISVEKTFAIEASFTNSSSLSLR